MQIAADLEFEAQGDGEPILFIHGGAICDGDLPLMAEPALRPFKLIRYHRRGYGGSSRHAGRASFSAQAADASALLHSLGVRRTHVVGHSYGGLIAMQLAHDAPDTVQSLVLSEPALSFLLASSGPGQGAPFAAMQERVAARDYVGAVNLILSFALGAEWRSQITEMLPGAPEQVDRDAASTAPYEAALGEFAIDALAAKRISHPVLSLRGTASEPRALEVRQLLHTWLTQTEDFDVVDATHMLQYHSPDAARQVAEGIASFVERHPIGH